jgi:NAD dependent epimerase/dehydratase family enzyme
VTGAVNGVAPNPVTNAEFTKALGTAVKRPTIFPVPAFGLKVLFGEMSEVLLGSQRVAPKAAEAGGYRFQFHEVGAALADTLK